MNGRFRRGMVLGFTLIAAAIVTPAASADGLPVVGIDAGPDGVAAEAPADRYVTIPARGATVVARIQQDGGRMIRSAVLRGTFGVPVVAFDGTSGGLSADGRTLVLIRPRVGFPRKQTTFVILDAWQLRIRDRVTLRGDFSFDALSPAGTLLYLVQYVSPNDPSRYLVRVFDTRRGRMLPQPIYDSREDLGESMRGFPVTRAMSPDGRWAYTLYDGAGKQPFVHALDTFGRAAVCIDLPGLSGRNDLYELRLAVSPDGSRLTVVDGDRDVAVIDTRTFRVSEPAAPPSSEPPASTVEPAPSATPADEEAPAPSVPTVRAEAPAPTSVPWPAIAAGGAALLASGVFVALRRRRPGALARADR